MGRRHVALVGELGSELSALLAASRAVMAAAATRFHPDLQPAAYQVAAALARHGPTKAGRLAEMLGMDKSAVSRLAKSLSARRLVEAVVDPDDGRGTVYRLTDAGDRRLQAADTVKSEAFLARVEHWSDVELAQLVGLLEKFNRS
ncbi:MarR family protein [Xanthomonas sp. GW]|uniref:MarR family winged helix-turn-helix transcriptional regulator n=1 Tax=Xanthomonas sp. GW TaxID=2724121 RepID=UPI00163B54CF|nr:MarR family winged helix-turn-helix transcriptional regulator [Xanthomonas sp. GW]QNH22123.1 MarR family protein [Xanthomonas sp. GW]